MWSVKSFAQYTTITTTAYKIITNNDIDQRCKTRIRFILYILYYKVYNSSCSQVGHDLIGRVISSPEQIKITASIFKHILCDDGSASCSGQDASMQ